MKASEALRFPLVPNSFSSLTVPLSFSSTLPSIPLKRGFHPWFQPGFNSPIISFTLLYFLISMVYFTCLVDPQYILNPFILTIVVGTWLPCEWGLKRTTKFYASAWNFIFSFSIKYKYQTNVNQWLLLHSENSVGGCLYCGKIALINSGAIKQH